jgi:type I restriction enzyme S subunit
VVKSGEAMQVSDIAPRYPAEVVEQELPPGYRRTELGVLPEDWEVSLLDKLAERGSGHTPSKSHPEYWDGSIHWISLKDSDQLDQRFIDKTAATITPQGLANSSAVLHPSGTVVLSRDAGIGKSAIMSTPMAVSQHFMAWQCGPYLHNLFLYYWLQSIKSELERVGMGNTIKTIGLRYFQDMKIPHPSLQEQRAIAEALSDVDELLGALEALIAKKRAIKQAAMQQLLTGKTRLPGFSGEWETASLDAIVTKTAGFWGVEKRDGAHDKYVSVIRAGDISPHGKLVSTASRFFSEAEFEKAHCNLGDVVITGSGSVGKVWWCDGRSDVAASNFVRVLRPIGQRVDGRYLFQLLLSEASQRLMLEHIATGVMANLGSSFFTKEWLELPPLPEQTAIATALSDMDAEIAALEARRDKTRAIKQGMMQQLLTGRVRLVKPEAAA